MSPRQIVVLGGGEAWPFELVRALLNADGVSFPPGSSPETWTAALARIEAANVVVVVLSAATIIDPAWSALAEHAVAWHTGLVIVVGDDTPLSRWPAALRDAMPTTVDLADPASPAELDRLVAELEPSRPEPWTPPPRPPAPSRSPDGTGAPWPGPPTPSGPDLGDGADDGELDEGGFDGIRMDEDVQFTVYRPSGVLVNRWSWLLVFAHATQGSADQPDPLAEVRRQAEGVLGAQASDYGTLSADSTGPLRRGSTLLVEPWLDGATFNPPTVELRWEEPVHRADFRFRVGADAPAIARGGVRIFVGAVVVGELSLSVRVGERPEPRPLRTSARRFRKVFASYSHADTEVVEAVARAVELLGDQYLIDSHDLRSGEDWQQRIGELIDDADVFQLFWSSNALHSHYVLAECRHALALRREGFIRPVYWQDPLPEDPTHDLPPTPIRRLHFSRLATSAPVVPEAAPLPRTLPPPIIGVPPPMPRAPRAATSASPAAAPRLPSRPSTAGPPPSGRRRRRLGMWVAVAAAAVVVAGVGVTAVTIKGGERGRSVASPATSSQNPAGGGQGTGLTPPPLATTTRPELDRAIDYLGAQPITRDPSCRRSAANPRVGDVGTLEEAGVDCTLSAGSGASVDFRSVVLRPGVPIQRYLDAFAASPGLQVVGGSLPNDPDGPYLDIGGQLPDGRAYSCRAWAQAPVAADTNAVAIACSGSMTDVVDFWRLHRS